MHALKRIHRSLRVDGVLLDIHPQPENSGLEIWQDGRIDHLGELDQQQDNSEIEEARTLLASVERLGLFTTQRQVFFEMLEHQPTVQDWMNRWAEEGYSLVVEQELLDSARDLLNAGGAELVIREPVRATLLRRAGIERGTAAETTKVPQDATAHMRCQCQGPGL